MEKPIRIYQCEDTVNGVLSAVYDAGISGYGHRYIRIQPLDVGSMQNLELFSEYREVETTPEKAESVVRAVREKISEKAYIFMMRTAASCYEDRGDVIYQFVTYGFSMGASVCNALQIPCVRRIFEINRAVGNEAHYFREFLRFQEVQKEPALLLAVLEPKNRILPMLTEHFADRLTEEWFIIFDKTHLEASVHKKGGSWEIRLLTKEEAERLEECTEQGRNYIELWKTFFKSVAIVERTNKKLQRNMLPLHYRKHMTEFLE